MIFNSRFFNFIIQLIKMIKSEKNNKNIKKKNKMKEFEYFVNVMNTQFLNNIIFYRAQILNNMDKKKIESPVYSLKVNIDYESLLYDLEKKYEDLSLVYNASNIDLK